MTAGRNAPQALPAQWGGRGRLSRSATAPSWLRGSAVARRFSRHCHLHGLGACDRAYYWRYIGTDGSVTRVWRR
jgi:hypothetical protein